MKSLSGIVKQYEEKLPNNARPKEVTCIAPVEKFSRQYNLGKECLNRAPLAWVSPSWDICSKMFASHSYLPTAFIHDLRFNLTLLIWRFALIGLCSRQFASQLGSEGFACKFHPWPTEPRLLTVAAVLYKLVFGRIAICREGKFS